MPVNGEGRVRHSTFASRGLLYTRAMKPVALLTVAAIGLAAFAFAQYDPPRVALEGATVYGYEVVKIRPHDPQAFTQGLVYHKGEFYEGTGLEGRSELRRVELETGKVLQRKGIPADQFGEGITLLNDKLYQITWKSKKGYVYRRATMTLEKTFTYATEGWGLTHDGKRLILSDGTPTLYFLDPKTLKVTDSVFVKQPDGTPLRNINELEFIGGEIWANVWQTDVIARIDPKTGKVGSFVNLAGLLPKNTDLTRGADVLNGIAYDGDGKRIFVTGKLWPFVFEIKLK